MRSRFTKKGIILFVLMSLISCEKPDRNNSWDDKANIDTSTWAPQNLQIEDARPVEKKLTWTYEEKNIEGFKIDRKKDDEPW